MTVSKEERLGWFLFGFANTGKPVAVRDCMKAAKWLAEHYDEYFEIEPTPDGLRADLIRAVSRHIPHGVLRPGVEERIVKDIFRVIHKSGSRSSGGKRRRSALDGRFITPKSDVAEHEHRFSFGLCMVQGCSVRSEET